MRYKTIYRPLQLDARVLKTLPLTQLEELLTIYLEMARRCAHEAFLRAQQASVTLLDASTLLEAEESRGLELPAVPDMLRQRVTEEPPRIASFPTTLLIGDTRGLHEQRVYLRIGEAATYCRVHRNTMRAWIKAGTVPIVQIDGARRIERKVLDALIQRAVSGSM